MLLDAVGVPDVETLFSQIPAAHRCRATLELPPALVSEVALRRHLLELLARNETCERNLSFLGGGIWQHHVPAVCDEVVRRSEFLTPVWGTPSSDHGRNQAWFEFTSQLAELIGMDFVGLPVYSWGCAAGHAVRMAARLTGRSQVLVPDTISPERLAVIRTYCGAAELPGRIEIELVGHDAGDRRRRGRPRAAALRTGPPPSSSTTRRSSGGIEPRAAEIAALARSHGAETIVGVDPISLGILAPPATTARTSSSAARSRSACTCPAAVGPAASSRPATTLVTRTSTRRCSSASRRRSPASTGSGSPSSSRPPTAAARRATTGRATPSTSGRSRTRSTCR